MARNNVFEAFSMKENIDNIRYVFAEKQYYAVSAVSAISMGLLMFYFTDYALIAGNMGVVHAVAEIAAEVMLAVIFGLNVSLLWYQLKTSSDFNTKAAGSTTAGSIMGIIVSGCPACGITLASYVGLASVFSSLPFYGLELKAAGIGLLLFSNYSISKKMNQCEVKK